MFYNLFFVLFCFVAILFVFILLIYKALSLSSIV